MLEKLFSLINEDRSLRDSRLTNNTLCVRRNTSADKKSIMSFCCFSKTNNGFWSTGEDFAPLSLPILPCHSGQKKKQRKKKPPPPTTTKKPKTKQTSHHPQQPTKNQFSYIPSKSLSHRTNNQSLIFFFYLFVQPVHTLSSPWLRRLIRSLPKYRGRPMAPRHSSRPVFGQIYLPT